MRQFIALVALVAAPALLAQGPSIGTLPANVGNTILQASTPVTLVEMTHPATVAASIDNAMVHWKGAPCTHIFNIEFVRPTSGSSFTVTAVRGPFDARVGTTNVQLVPPVDVQPGDMIAATNLKPSVFCGGVTMTTADPSQRWWRFDDEIATGPGSFNDGSFGYGQIVNVLGKSGPDTLTGIIPAMGSLTGVGTYFRTSVNLLTADTLSPISGRLVFHPQGRPATSFDPSVRYDIIPGETVNHSDVVFAMGASGLGSVDVISTYGPPPLITTRVYADNASGTSGFFEDTVPPERALSAGMSAYFSIAHPANFRTNVGVRSLGNGAKIQATLLTGLGTVIETPPVKNYPANYFEQTSLVVFSNTSQLQIPPDGVLQVTVLEGNAIVYTTTTDNRTNDSGMRLLGNK